MADRARARHHFHELPLVAILRGITPAEVVAIGHVLVEAGFRLIEVPLNSPDPIESIRRLSRELGSQATVGAGTVLSAAEVADVSAAGGSLIVSPNMNPAVIAATRANDLFSGPGVCTPTEAFAAIDAGADFLKLFPAEHLGPATVKAWRAVLPAEMPLIPVGGISPESMHEWQDAGVAGFGLGSNLYRPGMTPAAVRCVADASVLAYRSSKCRPCGP